MPYIDKATGRAYTRAQLGAIRAKWKTMNAGVKTVHDVLKNTQRELLTLLRTGTEFQQVYATTIAQDLHLVMNRMTAGMNSATRAAFLDSLEAGAVGVNETVAAMGLKPFNVPYIGISENVLAGLVNLQGELITNISNQLRTKIMTDVHLALSGGKPVGKVIGNIAGRLPDSATFGSTYVRAETIVRTEMGRGYEMATHSRLSELAERKVVEQKQWIATLDGRTRHTHLAAHGQIRKIDEPFGVGGYDMMHPNDPAGPPEETINCRCSESAYNEDFDMYDIASGEGPEAEEAYRMLSEKYAI